MVKKNKTNYLAYIPIIVLAITAIAGYVRLQAQTETNKTKTEELKTELKEVSTEKSKELEEVKKDNQEIEKSLTEMRVQQMYMQKSVDILNENLKELLMEIKKKK